MNTLHLLQIAFAAIGVVTALILVVGFIAKWHLAIAWVTLGDLLIYGVCGMLFGVAMAGGIVGLLESMLHAVLFQHSIAACLPGTHACLSTSSADLRDLVARIFLTGTALLGALGAMRLRLIEAGAAVPGKPLAHP